MPHLNSVQKDKINKPNVPNLMLTKISINSGNYDQLIIVLDTNYLSQKYLTLMINY